MMSAEAEAVSKEPRSPCHEKVTLLMAEICVPMSTSSKPKRAHLDRTHQVFNLRRVQKGLPLEDQDSNVRG